MEKETPDEFNLMVNDYEETPTEEWEEIADKIEELYQSGMYDADFRKKLIINTLSSHDAKWQQHEHDMYESLEKAHKEELAELRRKIEGMGDVLSQEQTPWDNGYDAGYNQARKDILALLGKRSVTPMTDAWGELADKQTRFDTKDTNLTPKQ